MIGVGPAAQMAAYLAAGVKVRRLAEEFELPVDNVTRLVLGIRLHEALRVDSDLQLSADVRSCMIVGCGRQVARWRLCSMHVDRLFAGRPLVGPPPRVIPTRLARCVSCGVTWCNVRPSKRKTCGDKACRTDSGVQPSQLRNRERDLAILEMVRTGVKYRDIADNFNVSERRVAQLANRAGLFRYRQRRDSRLGREIGSG